MSEAGEATVTVLDRVGEVSPAEWDALLTAGSGPFLRHGFLSSLEDAGTLELKTGWVPRIPVVRRAGRLIAAVPAYVKLHSFGEFVFDHGWANFAERIGVAYYPKLLVGVPFTPVTGPRFLVAPGEDRPALVAALGKMLGELAGELRCSGVHVNFALDDEVETLLSLGYLERHGIQYHWHRDGAASFDDYLSRFNSKRRNQLKRERRSPGEQGLSLDVLRGSQLEGKAELAYEIYLSTVEKFVWGRQYLNRSVFDHWIERCGDELELVLARREGGEVVAGAVNFASPDRLFGRYWGCFEELKNLHFNVCYYRGIEECIHRGLDVFEPGAGGEHKLVRGFRPTITRSAHLILHRGLRSAIGQHLELERAAVAKEQAMMVEAMGERRGP